MGIYVAWHNMGYLIDSALVVVADGVWARQGLWTESNELSSTEHPHGYIKSTFLTNTASYEAENDAWVRLLFTAVGVTVTVLLTVASTLLILWRRGSFQFTCMRPDLKMGPIPKHATNSAADGESEYEEPRSNETELSIYLEPIGIETAHTEDNNQRATIDTVQISTYKYVADLE